MPVACFVLSCCRVVVLLGCWVAGLLGCWVVGCCVVLLVVVLLVVVLSVEVVVVTWRCLAVVVVVCRCSCLFVSEVNELPQKHVPMMFSLIKNEGLGIKDFKVSSSSNHKPCRLEDGRLEIGHR